MRARMWNFKFWTHETNPICLMKTYGKILKDSGFTILQVAVQKFEPQGFTGVWILAESHLAVHTFPEEGKTYVELSSCNKELFKSFKLAISYLKLYEHNEKKKLYFLHGL